MAPDEVAAEETKGGGKLKKILILVVLLAVVGGAVWFFFLKPKPVEAPVAGEVVALEPIQINLAGGHYLRIGVALQLTDKAHEADGSKALDATIAIFSGRELEEILASKERTHLKKELLEDLEHLYHGDVMAVYFTEFVTQ
jgi:flagellar FliL protein